jgi:hypothetical protein
MKKENVSHSRYFGLEPKDLFFTLLIIFFFIACFALIFKLDSTRVSSSIREASKSIFSILQISAISALTLAFFYAYQLSNNISFFYLSLCWFAHVMYKIFTIGFIDPEVKNGVILDSIINGNEIKGEVIGYQYLLIGIIALVADLPLLLSSFSDKKRKLWHPLIPIMTLMLMVFVYNTNLENAGVITKIKFSYFVGPFQSALILLWLSYCTIYENVFGISRKLSNFLGITFLALLCSQIPFIQESYCFPCKENVFVSMVLKVFSLVIYSSILLIVFFIVKEELVRRDNETTSLEGRLKVKSEFEILGYLAASIEHELRNPLQAVILEVNNLPKKIQNNKELIEKFGEQFENLEKEVYKVRAAANVINILRLNKENFVDRLEETLVIDRVNSAIKRVKIEFPLWADKIAAIEPEEKTKKLYIQAYFPYIEQTFLNLLKNSYESIIKKKKLEKKDGKGKISVELDISKKW